MCIRDRCVTALGDSLEDAKTSSYELVSKISWENVQYRTDIGWRAIEKNRKKEEQATAPKEEKKAEAPKEDTK